MQSIESSHVSDWLQSVFKEEGVGRKKENKPKRTKHNGGANQETYRETQLYINMVEHGLKKMQ